MRTIKQQIKYDSQEVEMIAKETRLRHKTKKYEVRFKCMVNKREFRTMDDFQFLLSEFELAD